MLSLDLTLHIVMSVMAVTSVSVDIFVINIHISYFPQTSAKVTGLSLVKEVIAAI